MNSNKLSVTLKEILPIYRKDSVRMAEKFLWPATLQEISKTDKDYQVMMNFLCTTRIMKEK